MFEHRWGITTSISFCVCYLLLIGHHIFSIFLYFLKGFCVFPSNFWQKPPTSELVSVNFNRKLNIFVYVYSYNFRIRICFLVFLVFLEQSILLNLIKGFLLLILVRILWNIWRSEVQRNMVARLFAILRFIQFESFFVFVCPHAFCF